MREAEPLCAENIGLKYIALSRRGETNFSGETNNVLQNSLFHVDLAMLQSRAFFICGNPTELNSRENLPQL